MGKFTIQGAEVRILGGVVEGSEFFEDSCVCIFQGFWSLQDCLDFVSGP